MYKLLDELLDEEIKKVVTESKHSINESQSPKSNEEDIEDVEDVDCMICLEKIDDYTEGVLPCGCNNKFHLNCLQNWINLHNNCPICRKGPNISTDNLNQQDDYIIEFMNYFDEHQSQIQQERYQQERNQQYHHQQHLISLSNAIRNRRTYRDKMLAIVIFIVICAIIYRVTTL